MSLIFFLFDDACVDFDMSFTSHVNIREFRIGFASGLGVLYLVYGFLP